MARLLLLICLSLTSISSQAEDSWFDAALNFFGLADDADDAIEPHSAPAKPEATPSTIEPAAKTVNNLSQTATQIASQAATTTLTNMVTNQLGVSNAQAQGGLGTLFGLAKSTLGGQEFDQLSTMVPEMDTLLAAAPAVSEQAQGLSSLMGSAGKYGKALQNATQAYSQFKQLGVGVDKIPAYINVTNTFLKSQGSDDAVTLFQKGISALTAGDN